MWNAPLGIGFSNNPNLKPSEIDPEGTKGIYTWTNSPAQTDFVDQIVIDTEGTVEIDMEGGVYVDGDEVGRLQITDFSNTETMKKAGNGRFTASDGSISGERPENTTLSQGYLETANVNPVRAMTEMIETSRAFEAYQKVIQSADEATSKSINDVGKGI